MTHPQNIIIFGATGGIGSSLARLLATEGHQLVLAARSQEKLAVLTAEIGGKPVPYEVDDASSTDEVFKNAVEQLGRVDGVAHCVGSLLLKPAHLTTDEDWEKTILWNLTSAFRVVRAAGKYMKGGGSVVLFSSAAGERGFANHEAIGAAKAGICGLLRSAAATYARQNLRFNAVAPSLTNTPLTHAFFTNETSLKYSQSIHPLGRLGEARHSVSAARWLLSSEQDWMTGQTIFVDGGITAVQGR